MSNDQRKTINMAAATFLDLMEKGSPYWDPKHPQHQQAKSRVANHHEYQAKYNAKQREKTK